MAKRSTSRRLAMQALYQIDLSGISPEEAINSAKGDEEFKHETVEYASCLVDKTLENLKEIDRKISSSSKGWTVGRMGAVDRNILRLAVCELDHVKESPFAVIVDEAVELAKKYGGEESKKFINGVLSSFSDKKNKKTC
jgi:transcription antitermination protein NusB